MKICSSDNKNGQYAYPSNDPNYAWRSKQATKINEWQEIELDFDIGYNYNADEIFLNIYTWADTWCGTNTTDFDDLNIVVSHHTERAIGKRQYELSNHLGNVLATISDKKIGIDINNDGSADFYDAQTLSLHDYYPFGM